MFGESENFVVGECETLGVLSNQRINHEIAQELA